MKESCMAAFDMFELETDSIELMLTGGIQEVIKGNLLNTAHMYFHHGVPGIVWFDYLHRDEYEVLEYHWNGPRYREVPVEEESYTRRRKSSNTLLDTFYEVFGIENPVSYREPEPARVETREVPVLASMRLRDLMEERIVTITFNCTSDIDTRIRNSIASNLDSSFNTVHGKEETPKKDMQAETPPKTDQDIIARIRELKSLLDDGAITQEEYEILKKKLI